KLDASTGQPDSAFNKTPSLAGPVYSFVISGSSVYLVGAFDTVDSSGAILPSGQTWGILKLDAATGARDSAFGLNPGFGGTPLTVAANADAVYVGGAISGYGGSPASNIAKIDIASGVPDTAFNMAAGTDAAVNKILISGSSMYLGGQLYHYSGVASGFIAKADINTGAPDATFTQGGFTLTPYPPENFGSFTGSVNAMALRGTALYVGGRFNGYRGQFVTDLVKIDASSGNLDLAFTQAQAFAPALPIGPPFPNVNAVAATDDAVYVAGDFSEYLGVPVGSLIKLNPASGALDTAFSPPISVFVTGNTLNMALAVSGNSLYVGAATADLG